MQRFKNIFNKKKALNNSDTSLASQDHEVSEQQSSSTPISSDSSSLNLSNNNVYDQYLNLNNNLPKELIPIVTLLNCQSSRVYLHDECYYNIEDKLEFTRIEFLIKGTKLILFNKNNSTKPIIINILDSRTNLNPNDNILIIEDKLTYNLKFNSLNVLQKTLSAIKLSIYEFNHLNEAYTASLLSCKGTTLSDLHVVLADNRFVYEEQCSVKINGDWRNCLVVINPYEKKLGKDIKSGSILIYLGNTKAKKNLICSINKIDQCFAIFTHVDLIDESSIIKLNGEIKIYDVDESSSKIRSRSSSIGLRKKPSTTSLNSNKSNTVSTILNNSSIYLIPKQHHGVKNFETLIRFLIPIYDSFQLYGRPKRLNSNKTEIESLLFGLPSLPNSQILTLNIVVELIEKHWPFILEFEDVLNKTSSSFNFNQLIDSTIEQLYKSNSNYEGFGNLKSDIIQQSQYKDPIVLYNTPNQTPNDTPNKFNTQSFQSPFNDSINNSFDSPRFNNNHINNSPFSDQNILEDEDLSFRNSRLIQLAEETI